MIRIDMLEWYSIIPHDSQAFARSLEDQPKKKDKKKDKKQTADKKKVISNDTEWYWMIWNDID